MKQNQISTTSTLSEVNVRVSKKFYADIAGRVAHACQLLTNGNDVNEAAMALIDRYIASGKTPSKNSRKEAVMIFTLLKSEIDKAVSRSQAARLRAARKKSKVDRVNECETEKQVCDQSTATDENNSADSNEIPFVTMPNRRQRRQEAQEQKRLNRRRERWLKHQLKTTH